MKEVIFIASNAFDRVDKFKRIKAKSLFGGKPIRELSFLHFEARNDLIFIKNFMHKWALAGEFDLKWIKQFNFVYTPKKSDAISQHKDALEMGLNVSTLVDMDYDFRDKTFNGINKIHSTKYACTLFTIQFIKDEKELDFEKLENVIQSISSMDGPACKRIIAQALENTSSRLNKWRPWIMDDFAKKKIYNPLNDHELAFAILEESGVKANTTKYQDDPNFMEKVYALEEKIRAHAMVDSNGLLRNLLKRMVNEIISNQS